MSVRVRVSARRNNPQKKTSKRNINLRIKTICSQKCNSRSYNATQDKYASADTDINDCVITNTHISFRDCTNKDGITRYHYITPTELSVDTLQYAFNNGLVNLVVDNSSSSIQVYLDIDKFPTLLVETVNNANFKDTRRDEGFYSVYEDASTFAPMSLEEEKQKQIQNYLMHGIYQNTAKYKNTEEPDIPANYKDGTTTQNINYVRQIAASLNSQDPSKYTCDLQGIPDKYIIIEHVKFDIDGEEYVICGYPDTSKMRTYLAMLNNPDIEYKIREIHKQHCNENTQLYTDLHNFVNDATDEPDNSNSASNRITNIEEDLYKFMPKSKNREYLENWYIQNPKLLEWMKSKEFQDKIQYMGDNGLLENKELIVQEIEKTIIPSGIYMNELDKLKEALTEYDNYVNQILLEYLNKPLMRIRYYFLIYKKHTNPDQGLIPAIFNIKQLEAKHKPILEKVLDLIQTRIPAIFGILEDSRNKLNSYKLFHSYVKYGDFFYITTEYIHTMSNILHYAYIYKNSIALEELIYSCNRMSHSRNPFWHDVKIEYELKKFRIDKQENIENNLSQQGGSLNPYALLNDNSAHALNRNNFAARKKKMSKKSKSRNRRVPKINGQILLMYEKSYQEYVIIYKYEEKILVLEIKSNMANCIIDIKNMLADMSRKGNSEKDIYTCNNAVYRNLEYTGKLFKLQKDIYELNSTTYQEILKYNPLIMKRITYPKINKILHISDIFNTELIDYRFKDDVKLFNLHYFKPIMYFNLIMNQQYLDALIAYKNGKRDFTSKIVENSANDHATSNYGMYSNINCLINPNNCGYSFIEIYETIKIVVWILPFNNSVYINNFTYLNDNHLLLLKTLKEYYLDKQMANPASKHMISFVHVTSTYIFGLLHFHITEYDDYKRKIPTEEKGSSIIKEININELINKLSIDGKYYNDINISILNLTI